MNANDVKYYNMVVHFIDNNKLIEERVAVKNVFCKNDTMIFNFYFYKHKISKVIDRAYIHDLLDLVTEKYYNCAEDFYDDFTSYLEEKSSKDDDNTKKEKKANLVANKILHPFEVDIIILVYLAKCCRNFTLLKSKTIEIYILSLLKNNTALSEQYIRGFLQEVNPSKEDFYTNLDLLNSKTPIQARNLMECALKVCLSDGQIHYDEKLYLAEFVQTLRQLGVNVNDIL